MEDEMKPDVLAYSAIFTCVIASAAQAQPLQNQLKSGAYGNSLLVAINSEEQNVSGKFSSSGGYLTGEGWDCNFYFSGKTQKSGYARIVAISKRSNKSLKMTSSTGILIPSKEHDAVIIKLNDDISDCGHGEDLMEHEPAPRTFSALRASLEPLELRERNDRFEFRIISAKRSFFYKSASSKNPKKSYVGCGDTVMVTAKDETTHRVKAAYTDKKKRAEGWLRKEDILDIGESLICQ
jgi:hypothetical protein